HALAITAVLKVDFTRTNAELVRPKPIPVSGHMGRKSRNRDWQIRFESHQPTQHRADGHGRRPDLVRRASRDRLEIRAGKHFGGVTSRATESEQGVGAKIGERRQRAMVAVLAYRGPAGEQRPHAAEVVAGWTVIWVVAGDDAHTPVGGVVGGGEFVDHLLRVVWIKQPEPHGHSGQHAGCGYGLVLLVDRKGVDLLVRNPEQLVDLLALVLKLLVELRRNSLLACIACQGGERAQRLRAQA